MPTWRSNSDHWRMTVTLASLGWSGSTIAKVIGCAYETVNYYLLAEGGVRRKFPDRPQGSQAIYSATFRAYAQNDRLDEPTLLAIETLLDISRLRTISDGMTRAYLALCHPDYPPHQPYVALTLDILNRGPVKPPAPFEVYLEEVKTGRVDAPVSADEVVDALTWLMARDADRNNLMHCTPIGLKNVVDGWLCNDPEGGFDSRQVYVLTRCYGLQDQPKQSLTQIGKDLKIGCEHVRQIRNQILNRLRRYPYADQLRRIFPSMEDLVHQAQEYNRIVAWQKRRNAKIQDSSFTTPSSEIQDPEQKAMLRALLHRRCDEFALSTRASHGLYNGNIKYIWELCERSERDLLNIKHFGRKSLNEIKDFLARMGLELNMNPRVLLGEDSPRLSD